jgi:hypothetical protein
MRCDWSQQLSERLPPEQRTPRGFVRALFLPIHTHLCVLAFLLFWYFQRQYVASVEHVVVAGALMSGIFAGVRAALLLWLRDLRKAALAATLLCLVLLFFDDFRGSLAEFGRFLHIPYNNRLRYDLPLFFLLFGASIAWVVRTRLPLLRVCQATEAFSFVLVVMILAQILAFNRQPPAKSRTPSIGQLTATPNSTNARPDIYLIIADSRTSSAALSRYWNYSDSSFTSELKRLGFQCVSNATSEYSGTMFCISTLLNMEPPMVPTNVHPKGIASYLAPSIRNSRVVDFLSRKGYEIVNLSLFELQEQPRFYGYFREGAYASIFAATLPGSLWRDQFNGGHIRTVNKALLSELDRLPTKDSGSPKFVYAHVMLPHSPYLYDRHGQLQTSVLFFDNKENPRAYLEQLIYADGLLLETVRSILAKSKTPPIIIIRGDHGFRYLPPPDGEGEACQAFFAAYFPEGGSVGLPTNINHAVVFRDVLNRYFGTRIPLESVPSN